MNYGSDDEDVWKFEIPRNVRTCEFHGDSLFPVPWVDEPFPHPFMLYNVSVSEPSTSGASLSEPSTSMASMCEPSTSWASMSEPSASGASLSEPSTSRASMCEPSTSWASLSEPSTSKASMCAPSTSWASMSEPSTSGASLSKPSTSKASMCAPSTSWASMGEPSTSGASLSKPSTSKASMCAPSTSWASMSEPSTSGASLSKPSTSKASMCEPSTSWASMSEPSTSTAWTSEPSTSKTNNSSSTLGSDFKVRYYDHQPEDEEDEILMQEYLLAEAQENLKKRRKLELRQAQMTVSSAPSAIKRRRSPVKSDDEDGPLNSNKRKYNRYGVSPPPRSIDDTEYWNAQKIQYFVSRNRIIGRPKNASTDAFMEAQTLSNSVSTRPRTPSSIDVIPTLKSLEIQSDARNEMQHSSEDYIYCSSESVGSERSRKSTDIISSVSPEIQTNAVDETENSTRYIYNYYSNDSEEDNSSTSSDISEKANTSSLQRLDDYLVESNGGASSDSPRSDEIDFSIVKKFSRPDKAMFQELFGYSTDSDEEFQNSKVKYSFDSNGRMIDKTKEDDMERGHKRDEEKKDKEKEDGDDGKDDKKGDDRKEDAEEDEEKMEGEEIDSDTEANYGFRMPLLNNNDTKESNGDYFHQ